MPSHSFNSKTRHHHLTRNADVANDPGQCPCPPASNRRVLSIERPRHPADKDLEGLITSALLATDKQLGNVVEELDKLTNALKTGAADAQALGATVHPAVWYAVRHVILERELRHLALTDDLTCLYNRRGFFAAATQQLKLGRRNGHSLLLFFCDLDDLKLINDSFGHREGDRALVRTADALEEVFRDADVLARLGGDEFAVLAFEASSRNEETILGRLEKSMEKANEEDPRYKLSMSVGVARFDPESGANLAELMAEADRAMYQQKRGKGMLTRRFK